MSDLIEASIIIPTKDKISRLKLVLYALAPQIKENHEVIIVMDGCDKYTREEFNTIDLPFQPVLVICEQTIGRAAARNRGIQKAMGDILIFMDDDRIPGPNFIQDHIAGHKEKHGIVIGKRMQLLLPEEMINILGDYQQFDNQMNRIILTAKPDISWLKNKVYLLNPLSPIPWLAFVTSNLSICKKDIIEAGMFDEKFDGWGWEDTDLGYRLIKNKIKIIKKSKVVNYHIIHPQPRDIQTEELSNFKYFYEKVKGDYISRFSLNMIRMIRDTGLILKKMIGN